MFYDGYPFSFGYTMHLFLKVKVKETTSTGIKSPLTIDGTTAITLGPDGNLSGITTRTVTE